MKLRKRLLAALLTLCMVLGVFAGTAVTVSAADAPRSVRVDGEQLSDGDSNSAGTASYAGGVLTLHDYQGGGISSSGGDLTIEVSGDTRITAPDGYGVRHQDGTLTIQGTGSSPSLRIHAQNSALQIYEGTLTVQDLSVLECSSATPVNPVVNVMRSGSSMNFSNITTMLVRGNTSYSAVCSDPGSTMAFEEIGTLQVVNDNAGAISAWDALTIKDCGTVVTVSKNKDAIFLYGYKASADSVIEAERLLAYGGECGVHAYLGGITVDMTGVGSMRVEGARSALYESSTSIKVPDNAEKSKTLCTLNAGALAVLELSDMTHTYDGQPVTVTAAAKDAADGTAVSALSYIYAWYDADGTTPLAGAPADAGTYTVKVYGFSSSYYTDLTAPETATVTILPADRANEPYANTIGNGNNVYDLPALPEGMRYGTPEVDTSALAGTGAKLRAGVGGGKLSVYAEKLDDGSAYVVTVPVERDADANANYNAYELVCTLTAAVTYPRFDLCDGSAVITGSYNAPATDSAWASDSETAAEFGYTFAGWYTAPNGWGEQIADADGSTLSGKEFEDGTTYFAHWVAARAVAGYVTRADGTFDLAYAEFAEDARRTVYTTGFDFTQAAALDTHTSGDGYEWNEAETTLTLSGVVINAGASSPALILPDGTNVLLVEDDRLADAAKYGRYDEAGNWEYLDDGAVPDETADSYNNITGGSADIPSLDAKGDLTVITPASSTLSMRRGAVSAAGQLELSGAVLSAPGITADGAAVLCVDAMLICEDVDAPRSGGMDLSAASLEVSGGSTVLVNGDLGIAADIVLDEDAVLMVDGSVSAQSLSAVQISALSYCGSLECDKSITLDASDLLVTGGDTTISVYTEALDVTNGSKLTVQDYQTWGIVAANMRVDYSTVDIQNATGENGALLLLDSTDAEAQLTLERARITAPSGATVAMREGYGLVAKVGDALADTLTIEPYAPTSGTSRLSSGSIKIEDTEHGTITVTPKTAVRGTGVTITATPDGGYTLDDLTVADANGRQLDLTATADGKYTFTMPAGSATVSGTFRLRFTDLDPNAWYFDGVAYCLQNGLMDGVSKTRFAPDGTLTRAQLVTMLWRLEQQPGVDFAMAFTDVAAEKWYTEAVRWAAAEKLVDGVSTSRFAPDVPLTREQLVAILYRYAQYKGYDVSVGADTNILSYDDAFDVADYAIPAMQWACGAGLINGANGKLLPKNSTTRAQMAVILQRFCALTK